MAFKYVFLLLLIFGQPRRELRLTIYEEAAITIYKWNRRMVNHT